MDRVDEASHDTDTAMPLPSSARRPTPLRRPSPRPAWTVSALLALGTVLISCGGTDDDERAAPLAWQGCGDIAAAPFECATARVPLDAARPRATQIELQVIRHPATDSARRLGSIFFNPGGPGGWGSADLPGWLDKFPAALRERYDLVSWDPRGIGRSTAVRCFDSKADEAAFKATMVPGFPVGDAQVAKQSRLQAEFNQRCADRAGTLLEHVSTADTARDLERLRQALGEGKLNYLGVSYGTLLGATYANLFPEQVGRLVLDGNMDPVAYFVDDPLAGTSIRIDNDLATADTLAKFLELCGSAGTPGCPFAAADVDATREKYETLAMRLAARPATLDAYPGVRFTEPVLLNLTAAWLFVVENAGGFPGWAALAELLQALWDASETADGTAAAAVARHAPGMTAGTATGTTPRSALPARPLEVRQAASEVYDSDGAASAVQCGESPNPRDLALFPKVQAFAQARAGRIGAASAWFDSACASWPARAAAPYTGPWNAPTPPILVIGNRYDPSTAYSSSLRMSSLLANARMMTVEGYGHTVLLNPSECASRVQVAYFVDGTLPDEGTVCPQDFVPFATPSAPAAGHARLAARVDR